MFPRHRFVPAMLCGLIFTASLLVLSAQTQTGEWTLSRSDNRGKVRFSLQGSKDGAHFNASSDWNASDLRGIDWSASGKHDVHFTIARDAGSIECEGFLKDGEGAGLFTFNLNSRYSSEMQSLGFSGVSADKQLAFTIHDVTPEYIENLRSHGMHNLTLDQLVSLRIQGIN